MYKYSAQSITSGVELVAVSVRVKKVSILTFALWLKGGVVEREDVSSRTGTLLIKLITLPGFFMIIHFLFQR